MQLKNILLVLSLSLTTSALSHLRPKYLAPRQSASNASISISPSGSNTTATITSSNSTTIVIHDNETSNNPLDIQCAQVRKLTVLSSLSTNSTLLALVAQRNNLTAAETTALKSQAQNATVQLMMLTASNATLAPTCANSIQVSRDCAELKGLASLQDVASDPAKLAALQAQQNLTQAQVSELQTAAVNSKPLLQSLQANQTLVNECSAFDAARAMGTGVADAATAAVGNLTTFGTMANATASASAGGSASETGSPITSPAAAQTSPIKGSGSKGVENGYALLGTAVIVAVGLIVFG